MINGVEDHVHILAKLRLDKAVSDALRDLKSNASGWMHDVFPDAKDFSWQNGYGVFSVSQSNVPVVRKYIEGQAEHHQKRDFKAEFRALCLRHNVPIDERYVWD